MRRLGTHGSGGDDIVGKELLRGVCGLLTLDYQDWGGGFLSQ
jgi:hypothetical protein